MSKSIVLYLHMHQPYRLKTYTIFDAAHDHHYFNDNSKSDLNNRYVFERAAEKSYRPMLALLKRLISRHSSFRFSLSITGTFIEQAEAWAPDVLRSLKELVDTGRVEILGETYYHSLAFFYSRPEFERQVSLHKEKIAAKFGVTPTVFRNTELAYNNDLADWAERRGYRGIVAEGWDSVLEWRSPNHVYKAAGTKNLKLLLRNYRLSDDISFRFSNQSWKEWPLTAQKFAKWTTNNSPNSRIINLFMDFETFGEHQSAATGIFNFFEHFVTLWLQTECNSFRTVSGAIDSCLPEGEISMPHTVTWADAERNLSAWNGNSLQQESLRYVYSLEADVLQTEDKKIIRDWRRMLASDLTYYMSTKCHNDGSVHDYFSPYNSPYDAFLTYINTVRDMRWRIMQYRKNL